MKLNKPYMTAVGIVILIASFLICITGCDMGVSKESRLDMFLSDLQAENNTRSHFLNQPLVITDTTFSDTNMDPDPTNNLTIISREVTGDTFTITYNSDDSSGDEDATGVFASIGGGMSEDWYIDSITVNLILGGTRTIPDEL